MKTTRTPGSGTLQGYEGGDVGVRNTRMEESRALKYQQRWWAKGVEQPMEHWCIIYEEMDKRGGGGISFD